MNIDQLRKQIETRRATITALHQTEDGELREFTPEDQATYDTLRAEDVADMATLERHEEIEKNAALPERTVPTDTPAVHLKREAMEVVGDHTSTAMQRADATMHALEDRDIAPENLDHVRKVLKAHSRDREWANGILARSTDEYASAWLKLIQGRDFDLTSEERTVLGVTTSANGKYLLPTFLDPTIILTSAVSTNEVRKISRVVTLTDGSAAWNGITSSGVTASWDGEVVEVSDDSPTFASPSIPTVRAQALVQASISAVEDIADLGNDVMMMFADAKDRLEGAAHAVGVGTTTPKGVFTAVNAASKTVTSGTAATIALADIHAVYNATPKRYRVKGTWLGAPVYTLAIKALGTAVSASYSGALADPPTGRILGHDVVESDDAPTAQTTTVLDQELLFGDFSQFVIVDRPGGMSVEYIPHLFNTANNLPDGRRAWYATWRNGSDSTNTDAFRLLVDKTSA